VKKLIAPLVLGLVLAGVSTLAGAQATSGGGKVGYPPNASPFVDLEHSQELTLFGGHFHGHRDPANVAPQSGPLIGLHYSWRPTGPLYLITEIAGISSQRNVLNPARNGAARDLGTVNRNLYSADFDLGLGLTGGKSWHKLAPEISGGAGLISDFHTDPDSGGFKFGTRFAFNVGAGLKYVPGGNWQIRADIKDRMYTIAYPETYYIAPVGGTAVLSTGIAKSFWTNNPSLTLGLSYLF